MEKKNLTEKESKILSSVKREMARPRQAESVRVGLGAKAVPAVIGLAVRPARA
jgi:hypothetical protein